MNPFIIGGVLAAILAGPRLYSMVQSGQLDGTSAFVRYLLVAAICSVAATYVLRIVAGYDREAEQKTNQRNLLTAIAEAEAAKKRQEEAAKLAAQAKENEKASSSSSSSSGKGVRKSS